MQGVRCNHKENLNLDEDILKYVCIVVLVAVAELNEYSCGNEL